MIRSIFFLSITGFSLGLCAQTPVKSELKTESQTQVTLPASESAENETLQMPAPNDLGLVKTLNNMGYMVMEPDPLSQRFIDYIGSLKGKFLDVGAAFGQNTIKAFEKGASLGFANDIDLKQMKILEKRIPEKFRDKVVLMPGSFPDQITWPKEAENLDAILMARVIHFMTGEQIEKTLQICFEKLKPGGKVFILVSAPYLWPMHGLKRQLDERKAKGVKWPGYTDDIWSMSSTMIGITPPAFHMLDFDILYPEIQKNGFILEYYEEMILSKDGLENYNSQNGKETLGFVLRKPKDGV